MRFIAHSILGAALALGACQGSVDDGDTDTGVLLADVSETSFQGTFEYDGQMLTFESREVRDGVVEITVLVNQLILTATFDVLGAAQMDGFADNAEDTQIVDEDRLILLAFRNAVEETFPTDEAPAIKFMRRSAGLWSEWPTTLELRHSFVTQEARGYLSLCAYNGGQVGATHDCDHADDCADKTTRGSVGCSKDWLGNTDPQTYYVGTGPYIGLQGPCSYGDDNTWFWTGYEWNCNEPNHSSDIEIAYGNCHGRCGAGCGSEAQLTADCNNHDDCVREGHALASFWCDDDFSAASDDWSFAPNC